MLIEEFCEGVRGSLKRCLYSFNYSVGKVTYNGRAITVSRLSWISAYIMSVGFKDEDFD